MRELTPYALYALVDPRNNLVRYIGISKDVERRYKQHVQCNGDNTFKNAWIHELQQQGLQPICRIVDTILGAHRARRTETDLIWDFIIAGESLFNHEDPFMPPEYRRDVK